MSRDRQAVSERKPRLAEIRNAEAGDRIEREIDQLIERSKKAKDTNFVSKLPFWSEVLIPLMEAQLEAFSLDCWDESMTGETFKQRQFSASFLKNMRDVLQSLAKDGLSEELTQRARSLKVDLEKWRASE